MFWQRSIYRWIILGVVLVCPAIMYGQGDDIEGLGIGIDRLRGIAAPHPGVLIVAYECGVLRTEDSGTTWLMHRFPDCRGVSDMKFWGNVGIVAENSRIWRSTDTGISWSCVYRGEGMWGNRPGLNICAVTFADAHTLVAVGTLNTGIRSTDGGLTWTPIDNLTGFALRGVDFCDSLQGIITTDVGNVNRSFDGGATWRDTVCRFQGYKESDPPYLMGLDYLDKNTCVAISSDGDIFRSTDNGVNWQRPWQDSSQNSLQDVEFIDAQHGVVVGVGGTILYTADGGNRWDPIIYRRDMDWYQVHFISRNEVRIIGNWGVILHKRFDW